MKLKLLPPQSELETKAVLRRVALAHRALAELKGVVRTIPNENILNETLTLREARESSAIENIISTFDEIYQSSLAIHHFASPQAKEVHLYAQALKKGYELVTKNGIITNNHILQIQEVLIQNNAGFRKLTGTVLKNDRTGEVIYNPPQNYDTIVSLMANLEEFINNDEMMDLDPLVKMAIIHHQFESIHPFYDGNGRTGRILNILYLIKKELLELPILYLSRFIIQNKSSYYSLLQKVREEGVWEDWILFMLEGIEQTAKETIAIINSIHQLMVSYKTHIQYNIPKVYSREVLDNLFKYPYTKIEFLQRDTGKSRNTVISYLEQLVKENLLFKQKIGRDNFFINRPLLSLLSGGKYQTNKMEKYQASATSAGVTAYEILEEGIIIEFENSKSYLYDYHRPGKEHVEQMKILAKKGKGLTTYINQKVRNNYTKKLK